MGSLDTILALRRAGRNEEARPLLAAWASAHPMDAVGQYETACVHDVLGLEADAAPYYERAIALGLPDDLLREAFLGLGSTYRTLGRYAESEATFLRGLARFPDALELRVFYAMTLYNLQRPKESVASLLHVIRQSCADPQVSQYQRAIGLYADDLDRTW